MLQLHREGKLDLARQEYEKVLHTNPAHSMALQNLGVLFHQQGRKDLAVEQYRYSSNCACQLVGRAAARRKRFARSPMFATCSGP